MKSLKRIVSAAVASVLAVTLCSCSLFEKKNTEVELEGFEILKKAMSTYNKQSSGGIEVYDEINQKTEQKFIYWYDEVGMLTYYLEEADENGGVYKEYSSGYSYFVEEEGVGKELLKSDERFLFYDRELSVHPQTTDKVFYFSNEGVTEDTVKRNSDNSGSLLYRYDPEKAGMGIEDGKLESFSTEYFFDEDEIITHFVQTAQGSYDNGEQFTMKYTVTIIPESQVGPIENPIKVSEQTKQD